MPSEIANTVLLTTKCSGGCRHCPFSLPGLEHLFLAPKNLQEILKETDGKFTVLSGGEPFEHPQISEILDGLGTHNTPFRIATGGFIDLTPFVDKLKFLCSLEKSLQGISMGTDVISSRLGHSKWIPIWKNNIQLFFRFQIPYSLTFTVGTDLDFPRLNVWKWTDIFQDKPQFIYLRSSSKAMLEEWIKRIIPSFSGVQIIQDHLTDG